MFKHQVKNSASCHHGILALLIIIIFGLLLLVIVFKAGMMLGKSMSYPSSEIKTCPYSKNLTCPYSKDLKAHMGKDLTSLKKSAYSEYMLVTELTDTGFVAKDDKGELKTIVVNEDTKIIKGKEAAENKVSVGDKVYVEGSSIEASLVKIYDAGAELKK